MSNIVAIVSVVFLPTVTAIYALSRQRQQQLETRRDELRDVIDFAAEQAGTFRRWAECIHHAWKEGADATDDEARKYVTAWREALIGPRLARDRLVIRVVGDDPTKLVQHYDNLLAALDKYRKVLQGFSRGESYQTVQVGGSHVDVQGAQELFLKAAFDRVGIVHRRGRTSAVRALLQARRHGTSANNS